MMLDSSDGARDSLGGQLLHSKLFHCGTRTMCYPQILTGPAGVLGDALCPDCALFNKQKKVGYILNALRLWTSDHSP